MLFKLEQADIMAKDKLQELRNELCKRSKLENMPKPDKKEPLCKP